MGKYDIIIIGAGTGGYRCAEILSKAGKSVLIIDRDAVGGVCLNHGCIPTKAYIYSAETVERIKNASKSGICLDEKSVVPDFKSVKTRKDRIVKLLTLGLSKKLTSHGVTIIKSDAKIVDGYHVEADGAVHECTTMIIATGSIDFAPAGLETDSVKVLNSREILSIDHIPGKLLVIGAGVIGLEMATVFAYMGSRVTVVEKLSGPLIMSGNKLVTSEAEKIVKKTGISAVFSASVEKMDRESGIAYLSNGEEIEFDTALVAIGRKPVVPSSAVSIGVLLDEKGFIKTDSQKRTNIGNVYAVGDVTGGAMLAHKAYSDAQIACSSILDESKNPLSDINIPYSVFTIPSISSCGLSAEAADSKGINYKKYTYQFAQNGRAAAMDARSGCIEMLIDENNRMIGATIIGPESDLMIHELLPFIQNKLDIELLKNSIHIHPTLSEMIFESLNEL